MAETIKKVYARRKGARAVQIDLTINLVLPPTTPPEQLAGPSVVSVQAVPEPAPPVALPSITPPGIPGALDAPQVIIVDPVPKPRWRKILDWIIDHLDEDAHKLYKLWSIWFFVVLGAAPDLYNLAIKSGLFSGQQSPATLAYAINVISVLGAASRIVKQKKLEDG